MLLNDSLDVLLNSFDVAVHFREFLLYSKDQKFGESDSHFSSLGLHGFANLFINSLSILKKIVIGQFFNI